MTLSSKALAFSIQSLLSGSYNGIPTSPPATTDTRHFTFACSVSPACSDASSNRDHPKTPKSEAGESSEAGSSPEDTDQNGKKPRTIFSREQVQKLEEAYLTKRYLTRRERKELAASADISHTQVKIWFQNRRAKAKLKDRKAIALMQSAMTTQRLMYSRLPPVTDHQPHFLPPRPHNLIAPIPTKLPSIRPSGAGAAAAAGVASAFRYW